MTSTKQDGIVDALTNGRSERDHDLGAEVQVAVIQQRIVHRDKTADHIAVHGDLIQRHVQLIQSAGCLHPDAFRHGAHDVLPGGAVYAAHSNVLCELGVLADVVPDDFEHRFRYGQLATGDGTGLARGAHRANKGFYIIACEECITLFVRHAKEFGTVRHFLFLSAPLFGLGFCRFCRRIAAFVKFLDFAFKLGDNAVKPRLFRFVRLRVSVQCFGLGFDRRNLCFNGCTFLLCGFRSQLFQRGSSGSFARFQRRTPFFNGGALFLVLIRFGLRCRKLGSLKQLFQCHG